MLNFIFHGWWLKDQRTKKNKKEQETKTENHQKDSQGVGRFNKQHQYQ